MKISESATFVSVMAFLRPCTVYFKQVTHFGTSPHRKTFNQATSSSASVVRPCGLIKSASTVGSSAVNTVIGSADLPLASPATVQAAKTRRKSFWRIRPLSRTALTPQNKTRT